MRKYTNEEVFVKNSYYARHHIKKRCIEDSLIPYECGECSNLGEHNGKKLSLQLDHINGTHTDHRIENLRFLCPNCHSQTDTYAGKGSKGKRKYFKPHKPTVNFYVEKLKQDKAAWAIAKNNKEIRFGEWGWKSRASKVIGISSQKIVPWIQRVDPNFEYIQ